MKTETIRSFLVPLELTIVENQYVVKFNGQVITPIEAKQSASSKIYSRDRRPFSGIGFSVVSMQDRLTDADESGENAAFEATYEIVIERSMNEDRSTRYISSIVAPCMAWIMISSLQHAQAVSERVEKAYEENPEAFAKAQALMGNMA